MTVLLRWTETWDGTDLAWSETWGDSGVLDIAASPLALTGRLTVSGDLQIAQSPAFDVTPAGPLALTGRLGVAGDIQYRVRWEFETPLQVSQMTGALRVTGDIGFTIPFDVVPISTVSMHGLLAAAGEVASLITVDVAASAVPLTGRLAVTGDIGIVVSAPFDLAAQHALSLHGVLAATGNILAGSPFDLATTGGIALRGALLAAGDITSSTTPPAPPPPPPAPAEDPLDAKFAARRKRPNIRMRWGGGETTPGEPPAAPPALLSETAPAPRLARGLDLDHLPVELPAPPAELPPAAPAPAAAPPAPPAPPAPSVDEVARQGVAALQQMQATLQAALQRTTEQAVQRAADLHVLLQRESERLGKALAEVVSLRAEVVALKTKMERDARNRQRAEEITRKLLDSE